MKRIISGGYFVRGKIITFIMSLAVLLSAVPVYATENVISNPDDVDSLSQCIYMDNQQRSISQIG